MSTVEGNKAAVRRYLQADEAGFPDPDTVLAAGFFSHASNSDDLVDRQEFLVWARSLRDGLHPTVTIEDTVAEGDRVAVRVTWRGTHTGTFAGMAPTGRTFRTTGIGLFRIQDGRVSERCWNSTRPA